MAAIPTTLHAPANTAGATSAIRSLGQLKDRAPGFAVTTAAGPTATLGTAPATPDVPSSAPPPPHELIARCKVCGSENVLLEAWASWSSERQEWVLGHTFDHAFCVTCEGACKIECVPLEPPAGQTRRRS